VAWQTPDYDEREVRTMRALQMPLRCHDGCAHHDRHRQQRLHFQGAGERGHDVTIDKAGARLFQIRLHQLPMEKSRRKVAVGRVAEDGRWRIEWLVGGASRHGPAGVHQPVCAPIPTRRRRSQKRIPLGSVKSHVMTPFDLPKGGDTFRVLGERDVAYLDLTFAMRKKLRVKLCGMCFYSFVDCLHRILSTIAHRPKITVKMQ
jgi:hypothetical protein